MLFLGRRLIKRFTILFMGVWAILKLNAALMMFVSMAVSVLFYAVPFGLWYGAGICALLLVHELGHVAAARAVGIRGSWPVFIPFFGALITLPRLPVNVKMAANIAIGGPALGTLGALFCLAFFFWTDSALMLVMAYMGCLLNLFNLIPCEPLDGGKIAGAISPYLWWAGSFLIGALFLYTYNILIFVIFLFSLKELWQGKKDAGPGYYQISGKQRLKVLCWYIGLLCTLSLTTAYLDTLLRT